MDLECDLSQSEHLARSEGAETVTVDHVSVAHAKLQQEEIHRGMRESSPAMERYILTL